MAEYLIQREDLVAIADKVRELTGSADSMSLDQISSAVGTVANTHVKPISTKAAAVYTPTTSNQTIAAGTYCSGAQTIEGDANLVAENIAEGVSIFGVTGTHSGGTGGSGSSGAIETCTVTINRSLYLSLDAVFATSYDNVNVNYEHITDEIHGVIRQLTNVVCNSIIRLRDNNSVLTNLSTTDNVHFAQMDTYNAYECVFCPSGDCTITLSNERLEGEIPL